MTRRHLTFACEGASLVGTLDPAQGRTGLLIVTGGNELRAGPWSSQAQIAKTISQAGFPVFRFDRRGVGDSDGENGGFMTSAEDIAAAIAAFRAHVPTLKRIVAFGNCDGASALMLMGGAGMDGLVLGNPWTFDPEPEEQADEAITSDAATPMPPAVLRRHYLKRLLDPRAVWRLLTGKVQLGRMAASLVQAARPGDGPTRLAKQMAESLGAFKGSAVILLAENDRTAQAFLANWNDADPRLRRCPGASHSFVEPQARIWLTGQILAALRALG